jgi:phenylacetate-CoA oxygenase/reductase PaaK subunit
MPLSAGGAVATAPVTPPPARHALPDPGESVPGVARPTVALFLGSLALWVLATWGLLSNRASPWLTVPVAAAVTFTMFTVVHECTHHAAGQSHWLNALLGRLAMPFVVCWVSFPTFRFIHIEHHRYANDDASDPDAYSSHGPWWQAPFRWMTTDLQYILFYLPRLRSRPGAEVAETGVAVVATLAGLAAAAATGRLWTVALVYLIPERIGVTFLVWWFDWLPHHGLPDTQRTNRYRATRVRIGMEWLLTPLMLYQNYHLLHHLHPSIPFYRYIRTWRRNEQAYLDRDVAIQSAWGKALSPEEYRRWRRLSAALGEFDAPVPDASPRHAEFHRLPVASVERLTEDSVLIALDVPEELRDAFRFTQGQHLPVRTNLGGQDVRRNYSICAPAGTARLRMAVKLLPGGAFSSYAMERLRPGDTLEVMTPTGRFFAPLDPANAKHYVAVAAGSGITPILSLLMTTLGVEQDSRFTLLYGNRTADTTMFRSELEKLEQRYADRFWTLNFLSREKQFNPLLNGRIDREKLTEVLSIVLDKDDVDEWFVCGPMEMAQATRETLLEHGVDPARIHMELFFGYRSDEPRARLGGDAVPSNVTVSIDGRPTTFELSPPDSILDAALRLRPDTPYSCMGGACGTCRARLVEGTVEMDHNYALQKRDLDRGYVLTCQSHPTSPTVVLDYDA